MRIGFIGLGLMGKPMAVNLVKAGLPVTVHNRSQSKVDELVSMGAERGISAAQVAASADVVMTCLAGVETVREVITGAGGVLEGAHQGLILVDHSTVPPEAARELAERCAAKGVTYLDAPVSGTGAIVARGELTIMVGGDEAAFEQVLPVLRIVGKQVYRMGPVGTGNTTKLINNLMKDINLAGTLEGLMLGASLGVDLDALFEVVKAASGGSRQWERAAPDVLKRDFTPTSMVRNLARTQGVIKTLAESAGAPTPMFDTARRLWQEALEAGLGGEDSSAAIKVLERKAGKEARGKGADGA